MNTSIPLYDLLIHMRFTSVWNIRLYRCLHLFIIRISIYVYINTSLYSRTATDPVHPSLQMYVLLHTKERTNHHKRSIYVRITYDVSHWILLTNLFTYKVHMYNYINIHVYVHISKCIISIRVNIWCDVDIYTYMQIDADINIYIHINISIYTHTHKYFYLHEQMCIYLTIYVLSFRCFSITSQSRWYSMPYRAPVYAQIDTYLNKNIYMYIFISKYVYI